MKTKLTAAFASFKKHDRPNIFANSPEEMCEAEKRRCFACSNAREDAQLLTEAFPCPTASRTFDFDSENSLEIFPDGSLYEKSSADSTVWADSSDFRNERLRDEILTAGLREFFGEDEPDDPCAFRITVRRFFYGPLQTEAFAEEDGELIEFDSREKAEAWISEKKSGTYYLSHNESGSPQYIITPR